MSTLLHRSPPEASRHRQLRPLAVGAVVLAGQAMASLDTAIVNVGAPRMQRDLHLSGAALQAAVSSYVLVYAVGLAVGGRLGARLGCGRMFVLGTTGFTVASLACGLAVDPAMLIGARTVQGAAAALLVPQVLSLLQSTFHGRARARALALYGTTLAGGVALGQVLGGVIVSADLFGSGWRPIFLVNVPVGAAVVALSYRRLPAEGQQRDDLGLDLCGAALLACSILALVLPLTFGGAAGWPWWSWASLSASPVLMTAFLVHENHLAAAGGHPVVPPALLANRPVRRSLAGCFVLMSCYGALLFTIALHLQYDLNESALLSGLTFACYAAGFAAASQTWSRLPSRWHPRLPAAGLALFAIASAALLTQSTGDRWPWQATVALVPMGAAHGGAFGAMVRQAVEQTAPAHARSLGSVISTVTQLAIVVGVATLGTLYLSTAPGVDGLRPLTWVLLVICVTTGSAAAGLWWSGGRDPAGGQMA